MNELVANLAEKAAQESAPLENETSLEVTFEDTSYQIPATFIEQFAELIVRECAKVYWNIDNGETHTEYVNALKKHFGVEE